MHYSVLLYVLLEISVCVIFLFFGLFESLTNPVSLLILFFLLFFLGWPLQKKFKAALFQMGGMKFGRIILQVNMHRVTDSNFWYDITVLRWCRHFLVDSTFILFTALCTIVPRRDKGFGYCQGSGFITTLPPSKYGYSSAVVAVLACCCCLAVSFTFPLDYQTLYCCIVITLLLFSIILFYNIILFVLFSHYK